MNRVLLIEDDPQHAQAAARKLSDFFIVESVSTLAGGIARLREVKFDAVLLDIELPDAGPLDSLAKLKASKPGAAVVIFSGFGEPDFQRRMISQNASGYVVKGLGDANPQMFAQQIRMAIKTHEIVETCNQLRLENAQ